MSHLWPSSPGIAIAVFHDKSTVTRSDTLRFVVRDSWSEIRGQRFVVRDSWSEIRGQRFVVRDSWSEIRGQRFVVRDSWSEIRGQRFVVMDDHEILTTKSRGYSVCPSSDPSLLGSQVSVRTRISMRRPALEAIFTRASNPKKSTLPLVRSEIRG